MTVLTTSNTYIPFLCKQLEYTATPLAVCIVCAEPTGAPIAGVVYDCYNGGSIHAHIWIDPERRPSREWFSVIFDYPFNQLNVKKIIGQVRSNNTDALKLDVHFGFIKEAEVLDYFESGESLQVYTLTREQCRILNSPLWARARSKVLRGVNGQEEQGTKGA